MERYYGDRVFAKTIENPESATGQSPAVAPKSRIVNYLMRCADSLYQYSRVRKSILDMKDARKNTALFYLVLAIILLSLVLLVVIGMLVLVIWQAIKRSGTTEINWADLFKQHWRHGYYALVAILVFGYVVTVASLIYKKNKDIYNQIYNPDVMLGSEHIQDAVNMMAIDFDRDQPDTITTNNVLMYYYYFNIRKKKESNGCPLKLVNLRSIHSVAPTISSECVNVNAKANKEDAEEDEDEKDPFAGCCNLQEKSENQVIKSCFLCDSVFNGKKYITPFHPGMDKALWSVKLYRQLQRHDVPGMTRRIRTAMDYFKQLLLKRFTESASGLSLEDEKTLVREAATIATVQGAELLDLAVVDLSKATKMDSNIKTLADCYAAAFTDDNVVLVYFDKAANTGYTMTRAQLADTHLRYDAAGYANGGVFLRSVDASPYYVTVVGNNRNASYFNTYFKRDCTDSANRFGCSWAYTGANPKSGVVAGTSKAGIEKWTPDYTELLRDSSSQDVVGGGLSSKPNNMFAVTLPIHTLIKQKRGLRNSMVIDTLKEQLPSMIAEKVNELDPSGAWTFTDVQIDKVLQNIQYQFPEFKKEWHVFGTLFRDILSSTAPKLAALRAKKNSEKITESQTVSKEMNMYVTQEKFAEIIKTMPKEEFMGQFLFYLDELRVTSDGLSNLYRQFDISRREHETNQLVLNLTTAFSLIIAIMVLAEFGTKAYLEMKNVVKEESAKLDSYGKDDKARALKEQDIKSIQVNFYMKVAISIGAIVMSLSMIQAFRQKSNDLFEYNTGILNQNGAVITNTADSMFRLFFEKVMGSAKEANSGDDDLMYQRMFTLKRNSVDPASAATAISKFEHEQFIEMITAYDKCNILFSTSQTLVPFPMLEVSIYAALIVFLMIVLIAVTLALEPHKRVVKVRKLIRTKARLDSGRLVYDSEVTFDCDNEVEKKKIENLVKFVAIVLLVILPIMFSVSLSQNAATFLSTLYLSDYFDKAECYTS